MIASYDFRLNRACVLQSITDLCLHDTHHAMKTTKDAFLHAFSLIHRLLRSADILCAYDDRNIYRRQLRRRVLRYRYLNEGAHN